MPPDEVKHRLQTQLRQLRRSCHRKQYEVEQSLNLPKGSISKMERGLRTPDWYELYLLSGYYHISLEQLCAVCSGTASGTPETGLPQVTKEQLEQVCCFLESYRYHAVGTEELINHAGMFLSGKDRRLR